MRKNAKLWLTLFVMILSLSLVTACGSEKTNADEDTDKSDTKEKADKDEQITIKWAHQWGQEHFDEQIGKYVEEKFPNVKIEVQEAGTDHTETLEELIAAKETPDIVTLGLVTHMNFLEELGLAYDMDDLIDETGFDLDRLEPSIVEFTRNQDPNGEKGLYAIPNSRPTWSLMYNKDVFDLLGVAYPTDGMTWKEVADLAKDLTMEMDGVQYRGFDIDVPYDAFTQFSQTAVDPETDEVHITESEAYRRYLEMIDDFISIPGNYPKDKPGDLIHNWGEEFGKGEVAMTQGQTNWMDHENIDIATYPVWEGYENTNPEPNAGAYAITKQSEHKEEIMEVIEYLLSDEVQMEKSKQGSPSILVNQDIHDAFGEDNSDFDGKNVESLFKYEYATGPEKSSPYAGGVLWEAPIEYANSGKDINDFLRVLQEEEEENIRELKATK